MPRPLLAPTLAATLLLSAAPVAGQAVVALAVPNGSPTHRPPRGVALASTYQVRLTSDWPQYAAAPTCVNGGEETLTGTLVVGDDGHYRGQLYRSALIRFCGSHATAEACSLALASTGPVEAEAIVRRDPEGHHWELRWSAPPGATATTVSGSCAPEFGAALQRLYLSVSHALEVPLPGDLTGHPVRLEDYGWIVELR